MSEAAALLADEKRLRAEINETKARIRRSRNHLNNLRSSLARVYARGQALGLTAVGEEGEGDLHGRTDRS